MANYTESMETFEVLALELGFSGYFELYVADKKEGVALLLSLTSSLRSSGFHDNSFPPILNLYFDENSLLFIPNLVGKLIKSPSVTLTYAVDVMVTFLLKFGLQIFIVSLPTFSCFL